MTDLKHQIETSLTGFKSKDLKQAAIAFFKTLGYRSEKILEIENSPDAFLNQFDRRERSLRKDKALFDQWKSVDFLFQLTDDEIRSAGGQNELAFESSAKVDYREIHSYLILALDLKPGHYTRTGLATITREINRLFDMPTLILFRYDGLLTLSVIDRRLHKRDEARDVLEKVTLIKDIRIANPHRAHVEILHDLSLQALHDKHGFTNFVELHTAWQKALDSSELNKRFFQEIANWYFWAINQVAFPKSKDIRDPDDYKAQSVIRLITRLIFCWFVKEKGLIPDDLFNPLKLSVLLKSGLDLATNKQTTYYKAILQNLFFATLNQEMNTPEKPDSRKFRGHTKQKGGRDQHHMIHNVYRYEDFFQDPGHALQMFAGIPFLNGGLFECLDKQIECDSKTKEVRLDGFSDRDDNPLRVPDFLFFGPDKEGEEVGLNWEKIYGRHPQITKVRGLIHTFYRYKFTITENTPIEEEIALDPELSGKVFENLLAAYNPDTGTTARKATGSFFTPREIVNYMVDESIKAYLKQKLTDSAKMKPEDADVALQFLFEYNEKQHLFDKKQIEILINAIDSCKIIDPACGSGAFPMGILHKLVLILGKLDPRNQQWEHRQIDRVKDAIKSAEKIEDASIRERTLKDLERQIAGIEEAFESNELDYGRKLFLIENCIYGVDIQPIAVQIAKMRFFISLIVDQRVDPLRSNLGVRALPNLETKFVAANTLIGIERPDAQGKLFSNAKVDKLKSDLSDIRHRIFSAKTPFTKQNLRERDKAIRLTLAEEIRKSFVKANEDEIHRTRLEIEKTKKALEEEQSKPVEWEITRFTNLFGETEETRIDTTREKKRHLREQIKHLESSLRRATHRDADIDATASQLAAWDPYDQNASSPFFDPEWMFGIQRGTDIRVCDSANAPAVLPAPPRSSGFDVVIGNPPYIGLRTGRINSSDAAYYRQNYSLAVGQYDLFVVFIEKGESLLCKKGVLSYIVPKRLLSNESFSPTRRFLLSKLHVSHYLDAMMPFEAAVEANIIVCTREPALSVAVFSLTSSGTVQFVQAMDTESLSRLPFTIFPFNVPSIRLQVVETMSCNARAVLGDVVDVQRGMECGFNHPAITTSKTQFPVVRGENISRFVVFVLPPRHYLRIDAVEAKVLKSRSIYSTHPKLLTKFVSTKIEVAWDDVGYYNTNVVYNLLPLRNSSGMDLAALLGLLNSRAVNFWFANIFANDDRLFPHIQKNQLEAIPLPAMTSEVERSIARTAHRILAAKRADAAADTSKLEREIDGLVYALYGLTPEEIKIVDPASAVAPKASSVAEAAMEDKVADGSREASSCAEASPCAKPLRRDKLVDKTQGKREK